MLFRSTFNKLIASSNQKANELAGLNNIKPSVSHACIYIGLNATDEVLQLPKHNIWYYENYDLDAANEQHLKVKDSPSPVFYISFPSAKDSSWQTKHPGTASIQVIGSYPYEWVQQWENTQWEKRGDEYDAKKEALKQAFLEKLIKILPQIKDHIELCELSTPLSTKHFSNYNKGEIYGLEHTPERFRLKLLRPRTSYKNLYITGQDVLCVGVSSALFSGIITAICVLKKNLLWTISRYKTPA